ncbi:class I SAM-dependent methyltransferase [Myxosarcina sp. GI1]|uniref:class I SAM-dependent methyltransferase n=1 Tax=Myxosarcina sp. GI1 TaxID=1541065 RepID=UPI00068CA9AD|nr:class I SAM-dependent methyltransferase [Myxosarcina sp. GI1]
MTINDNPTLLSCLRLLVGLFIGKENLKLYDTLDWQGASDRFSAIDFDYPQYYTSKDFHGIQGGYLNPIAPVTYNAVTRFAAPPNEIKLRQQAIAKIKNQPQKILDLGCGTGSSTLILKQAFPEAELTDLDISPYMLLVAEHKAKRENLTIHWQQGLAEATSFSDAEFNLISVAFLFHETPVHISQAILQECQRLLKPGGQIIILDGNQQRLRHVNWLIKLFREPYSKVYANESVDDWLLNSGFQQAQTSYAGWISQITTGFKFVNYSL